MVIKSLERTVEDIERYEMIMNFLKDNPNELTHLRVPLVQNQLDNNRTILECAEQNKPFLAAWFTNAPEILTAMDLPWYCQFGGAFGAAVEGPHTLKDLQGIDNLSVPSDCCTLLRLGLYYADAGILPVPTAIIALSEPCDGVTSVHEAIRAHKDWRNIPMFAPDPPYFKDERSLKYFADELRNMTHFIEEHTGHKLDMDRLREVVVESNKQYELWAEYSELRRSVPCPHGLTLAMAAFGVAQGTMCGRPAGTAWFRDLVADAEKRISENRPEVPGERIRVLWFDVSPVWFGELTPWLEQEWGANVIQTMFTYYPYTLVDTSSEDTIFRDLAKRNLLDTPMIRQAQGTADIFSEDLIRIVNDYKIDCVVWPGHMGHKDGNAAISLMRETCRELGVPFLYIGVDQFDRRHTPVDDIKNTIDQFFTTMELG